MSDSSAPPFADRARRLALAIGLAYAVFGVAWILVSDALVAAISPDPAWRQTAQNHKGLFFIAITTLGLVLLVRASHRRLLAAIARAESSDLQVQDLFSRHPKPMYVFDRRTLRFLRVNDAAVHDYGWSRDEFLGMTLWDIRPPEDRAQLERSLREAVGTHRHAGVFRHRRKSGEVFFASITSHSIELDGVEATMVMAIDVTEEVNARSALQRQEAEFRQLHQSLAEVLWLAPPDASRLLYVSPAFETLYGRPPERFAADPGRWLETVHPDDRDKAAASLADVVAAGASACEYRIVRPDGSTRWVSDRKKLIHDADGRTLLVGGIIEDITALKERDEVRSALQTKLEALVSERTAELQRVNAELEAFTRTAAHDLKSPLNAIAGFGQILQLRHRDALGADGLKMVAHIERSAREMAGLVNDLLALSRVTSLDLQPSRVELAPLARSIVDELRLQAPARALEFSISEPATLWCDAGLARSLLMNLLGNAWKFSAMRDVARIRVEVAADGDATLLSVADNGVGFDAAHATTLFKPFERFHPASQFAGTGLGLATCQRIVQRHGGTIRVESCPGLGTTVFARFPARGAAEREHAGAPAA